MRSGMRLFSPDRSSYSAASHCGRLVRPSGADRKLRPGHQVRFGSLSYTADIRGDLIFDEFEPRPGVPYRHDGHDLALSSDNTQSVAQVSAPTISSEPTTPVGDGQLDAALEAATSMAIELDTSLVPRKARDSKGRTPIWTP